MLAKKKSKRAVPSREDLEELETDSAEFPGPGSVAKRLAEYGEAIAGAEPREVREIPLAEILDDGHNHRQAELSPAEAKAEQARIRDLADSIASAGLQQAICVYVDPAGKFHRVFGARRCAAMALLGRATIRAEVLATIPTAAVLDRHFG